VQLTIERESSSSPAVRALIYCALEELGRRYGSNADDHSLSFDELELPTGAFFVARVDDHLAGGVALRRIGEPREQAAEVKRLWVRPDLRQSGVAQRLMVALEEFAPTLGVTSIYLETGDKQPEAIKFYARIGYERIAAFPDGVDHYPEGLKFLKVLTN
jgi:GNAT superfamily N-acetyltransferase